MICVFQLKDCCADQGGEGDDGEKCLGLRDSEGVELTGLVDIFL